MITHRMQAGLRADPARVIARLLLSGEELQRAHSWARQVIDRGMNLAEDEVERLAAGLIRDFSGRHHKYEAPLRRHASIVAAHIEKPRELTATISVRRQRSRASCAATANPRRMAPHSPANV
jgi:hypothetical protein